MKILIIGTSNSIIGINGYINVIKRKHDVDYKLSGRVPFFFHLNKILELKNELEKYDLILIDHAVNDIMLYGQKIKDYEQHLNLFYKILSTINTNILNLLFPIKWLEKNNDTYLKIVKNSKKNNISMIDLNSACFSNEHYKDDVHLNTKASSLFGAYLSSILSKINKEVKGGVLEKNPYTRVLFDKHLKDKGNFTTKILNVNYYKVNEKVELTSESDLISLGYVSRKNENNVININNKNIYLNGNGYFHDYLNISNENNKLTIGRYFDDGKKEINSIMDREKISKETSTISSPKIVDALFYNNATPLITTQAKREFIEIDIHDLNTILINSEIFLESIKYKAIDAIRDLAIQYEEKDISICHELLKIANRARPDGVFIKKKLEEVKQKLN